MTSRPPASRAWLAALLAALAASLAFLVYAGYRTLAQPVAAVTPATARPLPSPPASPVGAAVAPPEASSERYPPEDPRAGVTQTPEAAFRDLRTALERKDAAAAARYLLAAKRAQMQSVEEALSELTPLEAQGVRITKTTQRGDKAALFARAESPDITSADGTPAAIDVVVQMVREGGQWKVSQQLWLVNTPPAAFQQKAIAWLGAAQE